MSEFRGLLGDHEKRMNYYYVVSHIENVIYGFLFFQDHENKNLIWTR